MLNFTFKCALNPILLSIKFNLDYLKSKVLLFERIYACDTTFDLYKIKYL